MIESLTRQLDAVPKWGAGEGGRGGGVRLALTVHRPAPPVSQ